MVIQQLLKLSKNQNHSSYIVHMCIVISVRKLVVCKPACHCVKLIDEKKSSPLDLIFKKNSSQELCELIHQKISSIHIVLMTVLVLKKKKVVSSCRLVYEKIFLMNLFLRCWYLIVNLIVRRYLFNSLKPTFFAFMMPASIS